MTYRALNEYLALPWNYEIEHWEDQGGYYAVRVLELPGCIADGQTPWEAFEAIKTVMPLYIQSLIKHHEPVPEPLNASDFKGQISYRTKPEKHYRLAREAKRRGISINKLIDDAIDNQLSAG
jgi:antitoxin HicB